MNAQGGSCCRQRYSKDKQHTHHAHRAGAHNEKVWDKKAAEYDEMSRDFVDKAVPSLEQIMTAWAGFRGFDQDRRALDFGAGTGNLTIPLARMCGTVTAIDVSSEMLKRLRDKAKKTDLSSRINAIRMELTPEKVVSVSASGENKNVNTAKNNTVMRGSYDLVLCSMVLHHVPDMAATLSMLKSLLKPGGALILFDFMPESKESSVPDERRDSHGVFHAGLTQDAFISLAESVGLSGARADEAFSFAFRGDSMRVLGGFAQNPPPPL